MITIPRSVMSSLQAFFIPPSVWGKRGICSVIWVLSVIGTLASCSNYGFPEPEDLLIPNWGKSTTVASNGSVFHATATDADGNIIAVGSQKKNVIFGYGNGITATGAYTGGENALIVKYNALTSKTQWASSTTTATNKSEFFGAATDSEGNVYAVGYITNNSSYNYGNGVTVQGAATTGNNAVIVKYNNKGEAQWARSTTTASSDSVFYGITIDKSGNLYIAGVQSGNDVYGYGNSVMATGVATGYNLNAVVVKYNSKGQAQWARSTTVASEGSEFKGIATDSEGNLYAVGNQYKNGTYGYGNGVSVQGAAEDNNAVIVKYNSKGEAQWARSTEVAGYSSNFTGVATDRYNNIYAVGSQGDDGIYDYGSGSVQAAGADGNALLVKYNGSGQAQWAKTTSTGNNSKFASVATTFAGDVYCVGSHQEDNDYGTGNIIAKSNSANNAVLVKYNTDGKTVWAKTQTEENSSSNFEGITAGNNKLFVVGFQNKDGAFNYENDVDVKGAGSSANAVITAFKHYK